MMTMTMTIRITSAADARKAFPNADIGPDGIFSNSGSTYLNCAIGHDYVISGTQNIAQIMALAYWASNPQEFAKVT
ncbi:hypothetical protein BH10PSE16_BH10PSE16_33060 [soil metagenome]